MNRPAWLALTLILTTSILRAENKQKATESLIEHAKQLSDIRADGAPPFRLKARFTMTTVEGSTVQGTYEETWFSRERWRQETIAPNFHRIVVVEGRKRWTLEDDLSLAHELNRIESLTRFSFPHSEFWKTDKIEESQSQSAVVTCVISKPNPIGGKSAYCFDKGTGFLLKEVTPYDAESGIKDDTCLFGDYEKFVDKMMPRSVLCLRDQKESWRANLELTAPPNPSAEAFVPPVGAKESVNCLDAPVVAPHPTYTPDPAFPKGVSENSYLAVLWMVVGVDGKPHDIRVVGQKNPAFTNPAIDAVQRWIFRPATCGGQPVAVQINVEVSFRR
jgi:hypothetical protein